jgi:hypothetical protein
LDFDRGSFDYEGVGVGVEERVKIYGDLSLTGKIEYNDNDLDARVKGKEDGVGFTLGARIGF